MKEIKMPQFAQWKGILLQYRYVVLVMVVGILLLMLPTGTKKEAIVPMPTDQDQQVAELEQRLSDTLSKVQGAGNTDVILTIEDNGRRILAQNIDRNGADGTSDVVTVSGSDRGEDVVELQNISPNFRGALIVSQGGDDPVVQLRLISAVSVLTGLGSDKISICVAE